MVEYFDDRPLVAPEGPDGDPVLQVDRLDAVVKHALNSENWNQRSWMELHQGGDTACGTSYCIAGFAAVEFAGLEPIIEENSIYVDFVRIGDRERSISGAAREYLGLTWNETERLFASDNNADDVTRIVEEIKNGAHR
jgi:hypothetical protein